jgi:hypothetical protein
MLPAISVPSSELAERIRRIEAGASLSEVVRILGGEPYKVEQRGETTARFWRFEIHDPPDAQGRYEIFFGEFEGDVLSFGAMLPRG